MKPSGVVATLDELVALRRLARKPVTRVFANGARSGVHASRLRGRGMEFAEVRNYQAGDEIRHMDWRVTARMGRPHIKQYEEARERPLVLVVDFNPSMYFGTRKAFKSVLAVRLAALMAWTALKEGDRVGGLLFSPQNIGAFPPRGREEALLRMLSALCDETASLPGDMTAERPLSEVFVWLNRVVRPGSLVVLISDFYALDEASHAHLYRLLTHNSLLACRIADVMELQAPIPGHYPVSNGHEMMDMDLTSGKARESFVAGCDARLRDIESVFRPLGIPLSSLDATMDLHRFVHDTFPGRCRG